MIALDIVFALFWLPAAVWCGYLFVLTLFSARPSAPGKSVQAPSIFFDIVVPAHNEEAMIGDTVAALQALDYPKERYRIIVVADNCTDSTESKAREAGCHVIRRTDSEKRGKGYALKLAFEQIEKDNLSNAVVVIDADTFISANLLSAFAQRIERGESALQARYAVLNTEATWRTRLMAIALALFHDLRSLARERLGLSCGLRGNGMAFSREALRNVSYQAYSLVEDLEYGIALGEAGYRIAYVDEAYVKGHMAAQEQNARSQRRRWEEGRRALMGAHGFRLLWKGIRGPNRILLDLAMDLMVPPLSTVGLLSLMGTVLALVLAPYFYLKTVWAWAWLGTAGFLLIYVLRGVVLSGSGIRGLLALAWAPAYVLWKVFLMLSGRGKTGGQWIRTDRDRK